MLPLQYSVGGCFRRLKLLSSKKRFEGVDFVGASHPQNQPSQTVY